MRHTRIHIDELSVDCMIGCLERERLGVQRLRVDLSLELDTRAAAKDDALALTWDYAQLTRDVTFILQSGRFYLLETAAQVLLRYLLCPVGPGDSRSRPVAAEVSLTKHGVLPGGARPRVVVSSTAAAESYVRELKDWGTVDVIAETRLEGVYRLNIAAGMEIPDHHHERMRESEMVLSGGLLGWKDGGTPRTLRQGERFSWARGQRHGYRATERAGSLLCIDTPPFEPADEIVDGGVPHNRTPSVTHRSSGAPQ